MRGRPVAGNASIVSLRKALLSRILGLIFAVVILLTFWCGAMAWISVQNTAREWNRSVVGGLKAELSELRNAYKARALRVLVGSEPMAADEVVLEVEPNGEVTFKHGGRDDVDFMLDRLRQDPNAYARQDFYASGDRIFHVVSESFLEDEGKRRAIFVKFLGDSFAKQVAGRSGMEILLVSNGVVAGSSLLDGEGHVIHPAFPNARLDTEHEYVERLTLSAPGYRGIAKAETRFSGFYGVVPIANQEKKALGSVVVLLPENLPMRGLRRLIFGSVAIAFVFAFLAITFMMRTVTRITDPLRATTNELFRLSTRITKSLESEGQTPAVAAQKARGDEASEIEELNVLSSALVSLDHEMARSERYQEELKVTRLNLQRSNDELERFAYSVSHDLRAPLRAIDGFGKLLVEKHESVINDEAKRYVGRIRAATNRMGQLIDDILNLSRLSRVVIKRDPVDLSEIATAFVADLKRAEPERHVDVRIEEGLIAQGTESLLRSVVENLIGNAWKFTSKKPSALIEFGTMGVRGRRVFYVRDNGAGFDMAHYDKLFGVFQRLHGTTEFSGTGVGLASVQKILHRHGGDIWAEGEVEKGATFYFYV